MVADRRVGVNGRAQDRRPRKPPESNGDDRRPSRLQPRKVPGLRPDTDDDLDSSDDDADTEEADQGRSPSRRSKPKPSLSKNTSHNDVDDVDEEDAAEDVRRSDDFVGSSFQSRRDFKQDGIFTPRWAILVSRTRAELLVVSQLAYWFGTDNRRHLRAKHRMDGYYWVFKTCAQLGREIAVTRDEVRWALRKLKERGVVVSVDDQDAGHRVYYRLDAARIREEVDAVEETDLTEEDDE